MKPEPRDTLSQAASEIRRRLLERAPAGMRPRDEARLSHEQARDAAPDRSEYIEFERAGSNITLHIEIEDQGGWRREPDRNTAGDEFHECKFSFDLNWPCHGSCDPATAMARLAFYQQVALFAAELGAEFGGRYWRAGRTAGERAEQEAKAAEAAKQSAVRAICEAHCKGLKIGGAPAAIPSAECAALADGEYDHAIKGRRYRLAVRRPEGAAIPIAMLIRIEDAPEQAPACDHGGICDSPECSNAPDKADSEKAVR